MLMSLIGRLFGRKPPPPVAPPPPKPAPRQNTTMFQPTSHAPSTLMADAGLSTTVVGARRPLVNADGQISGFEFNVTDTLRQRMNGRADDSLLRAHLNALFGSMRLCVQGGHFAFTELPAAWLPARIPETAQGHQIALRGLHEVEDATQLDKTLSAWRRAGAVIGWRITEQGAPGQRPDFVICDSAMPPEAPRWVAPYLPDVDTLESALRCGAGWAGSAVMIGAEPREAKSLPPAARHLMRLLNKLIRDEDTEQVVGEIKGDAALSVRLLQHLNSAGMSRGTTLVSIEQAVSVLGRDALYHWVSGMLVRMGPPRPAAATLQARALWRARMLEMMARAAKEPQPGSLYLMGLTSVLPMLLQISMADALESMQLPAHAAQALQSRDGPWAVYLSLVEALEKPDMAAAQVLAEPLGGLDAMMSMSANAWKAT